jgi:hypothetical protein
MGRSPDGGCVSAPRRWDQQRKENDVSASIVRGVDGSAESRAALRVAARLAARLRLRLVIAYVAELRYLPYAAAVPFAGTAGRTAVMEEVEAQQARAERLCERVAADAA